jgi:superoxide dismutase
LQYKNVRADYLNAIWQVINFHKAEERLIAAAKVIRSRGRRKKFVSQ